MQACAEYVACFLPLYYLTLMFYLQKYKAAGQDTIVLAGAEYGSGSSRDWAAKGPALLVSANFMFCLLSAYGACHFIWSLIKSIFFSVLGSESCDCKEL